MNKPKQTQKITLIALTSAVVLTLVFGYSLVRGQSVDEIKDDISEKQEQLQQINNEIQNLQREINRRQREAASLKNEVALFDLQIQQNEAQISAVQTEIDLLSDQITQLQLEIEQTQRDIDKQKKFLAETLRLINEYDTFSTLEITFGNDNFSDFLDQVQYASNLQQSSSDILKDIQQLKIRMEDQKIAMTKNLRDQENARAQLAAARNSLDYQRAAKQVVLDATRGQEQAYQELLGQAAQKQQEVGREIFELEVAIRREVGDKSLPPITGLLRWPTSGILTQGYGNTGFTSLGYNFHNGLDIAAPAGTKIVSAGDGVVAARGTGEAAYGNWIVIKHTLSKDGQTSNIYTLYAHLQSFAASTGQPVQGGDVIGYMGNTGNTTRLLYGPERGYHLHFTVFDEDGFSIQNGAYASVYGPYQVPVGFTYDPLKFLK